MNFDYRGKDQAGIQVHANMSNDLTYHTRQLYQLKDSSGNYTLQAFKDAFPLNQTHTIVIDHVVGNPDLCRCWLNGVEIIARQDPQLSNRDSFALCPTVNLTPADYNYNDHTLGTRFGSEPCGGVFKSLKVEDCSA